MVALPKLNIQAIKSVRHKAEKNLMQSMKGQRLQTVDARIIHLSIREAPTAIISNKRKSSKDKEMLYSVLGMLFMTKFLGRPLIK